MIQKNKCSFRIIYFFFISASYFFELAEAYHNFVFKLFIEIKMLCLASTFNARKNNKVCLLLHG